MRRPEERYAEVVEALVKSPNVSQPTGKRGFGSSGLYAHGKLFAFLSYKKRLIVKLPSERVDELVAGREGRRFDPRGKGRALKEWFVLKPSSKMKWLPLAKEGMRYVVSMAEGETS